MSGVIVEVWRGDVAESRHRVHVAVVDAGGRLRACAGDPGFPVVARSAIKPLQALPLVEDGAVERFGITTRELAICCGSHNGEAFHVDAVRSILKRIGAAEDTLACGPHAPLGAVAAKALRDRAARPRPVHNNCSGKHAGMLALARHGGWQLGKYHLPDHPVQRRIAAEVARWSGMQQEDVPVAIDGCGVPTFAVPLRRLAGAFASFASAARWGKGGAATVVRAMVSHPEYVGGTDRLCTDLMRLVDGRIIVKVGAEGVFSAAIPGAELGVALKVEDGARRAAGPALIGVLRSLGLLSHEEVGHLARFAEPDVVNTLDQVVGRVRAVVELAPGGEG